MPRIPVTKVSPRLFIESLNMDQIYLSKRMKVLIPEGNELASPYKEYLILTLNRNLENLGFTLAPKVQAALMRTTDSQIIDFYDTLLPLLKKMVGAHRKFSPMYPNFPQQVIDASDAELYGNALVHYWSTWLADVTDQPKFILLPKYFKEKRDSLDEMVEYKVINLGTEDDFLKVFTSIISANTSITPDDKEIVKWFARTYRDDIAEAIPAVIPQKENLAVLAGALIELQLGKLLYGKIKTATDYLRIATAMSGGDVSLAKNTKFRNLTRAERRFFMFGLESLKNITEDVLRHGEKWKRLGKLLHPGEYKACTNVRFTFEVLRNNNLPFETFNTKVENIVKLAALGKTVDLSVLASRPGDFARRLDHILRVSRKNDNINTVNTFLSVADKVSTPVLLSLYQHFSTRADHFNERFFLPKGNLAKIHVEPDNRQGIYQTTCNEVARGVRKILVARFAKLPSLGNVYLDKNLKGYIVPFAQRAASKALRTVARGSRIPMTDKDTIRFFLWWKQAEHDRVDIDLSASLFDENWKGLGYLSYYQLKGYGGHHSGDITSAPNGACEFIDLSISKTLEQGVRYVAMSLNSYCGQPYKDLPECFAGWMAREKANSGEIFDARTVENKIDLAGDTGTNVPVILDLKTREVIWADLSLGNSGTACGNASNNRSGINAIGRYVANINKPNLYDLFSMHVESRGKLVKSANDAQTVFSEHSGVTPFDYDIIASEYMVN